MPTSVPVELKEALVLQQATIEGRTPSVVGQAGESPTTFCSNTTDFRVNATFAHIRNDRRLAAGLGPAPYHLEICPTAACPLTCKFCSYTMRNQSGQSLRLGNLLRLLDDAELMKVVGIYLSGGGDPLAYRDICTVIERAAEFSGVAIQTNGVFLDPLLKAGYRWFNWAVDLVTWSIYAADEHTFSKVCGTKPAVFSRIVENIKCAVRYRDRFRHVGSGDESSLPPTHISGKIIVHRGNYLQLEQTVEFARALNLDTYHIRLVDNFEPGQDVALSDRQKAEMMKSIEKCTDPLLRSLHDSLSSTAKQGTTCPAYTLREGHVAIVETDDSVYLSIPSDGLPQYSLGNLNNSSLRDLWFTEHHKQLIRNLEFGFLAQLTKDRHHKNDLAIHQLVSGQWSFQLSPEMLTARNFRMFQRPQL